MYASGAINYSAPDVLTVATSASNIAVAQTAPIFGSLQRRITDTAVWLEFEGPKDVGVNTNGGTPFVFLQQCGTAASATSATATAAVAGSLNPSNFHLVAVTGLTANSVCAITVELFSSAASFCFVLTI